jgi:tRNA-dihydrouridine synthase B
VQQNNSFSTALQKKIESSMANRSSSQIASIPFNSPLILAPMSAICSAPYRLLMEQLGAGGTVSELISCHGILHANERTRSMLRIDPREKVTGIQLFGEDAEAMADAALIAEEFKPQFIDINMGCPVRKVVSKGGGSALLRDVKNLVPFLSKIKKSLKVPLTIKIRTGWDEDSLNSKEVVNIAYNEGVEFVAVHGRTRNQKYKGLANWDYLEDLAKDSPLPIIGNGDLHSPKQIVDRLKKTNCPGLMIGRGAIRNPFIFLESYNELNEESNDIHFGAHDYFEVALKYHGYLQEYTERERSLLVQMRKHLIWFASGLPHTAKYRDLIFKTDNLADVLKISEDYFLSFSNDLSKNIDPDKAFMAGGHG